MMRTRGWFSLRRRMNVLIFLLPSLIGFCLFVFIPTVSTIYYSFTDYTGGFSYSFIGLDNYYRALTSGAFRGSLWITIKFALYSVFFQILLGFVFAMLLNHKIAAMGFYRAVIFLPVVLSQVAIALVFMLILHPSKGPVNNLLVSLGLPPQPWLASPRTALGTIAAVNVWQSFGYYMVLFLSGLQTINPESYEAASIDGANAWQRLLRITIPMVSPTTFLCVILAIINAFRVFDQVFIMTGGQLGGGPAGSTTVLVFDIYRNAFQFFQMGYASSEATILLVFILLITVFQYRGQHKWVNYDQY